VFVCDDLDQLFGRLALGNVPHAVSSLSTNCNAVLGRGKFSMRELSLTIIAATLVVGPTITWAADLPPSPPQRVSAAYVPAVLPVYNWAGVYVGINGGWGWGNGKFTIAPNTAFPTGLSGTPNDNGGVVGATLGANFQTGAFVFGVWRRKSSFVCCREALLMSAESKVRPDFPMLSAVIAHSQIVVTLPDATAQRFPANFDAVDIAILEWIVAEARAAASFFPRSKL
jgi:hypothetical protein